MLGDQFRDTHFFADDGRVVINRVNSLGYARQSGAEYEVSAPERGIHYTPTQGLLFYRSTATGKGRDPLLDRGERMDIARRAVGAERPVEDYQKKVAKVAESVSADRARRDMDFVATSLANSPMTNEEMTKVRAEVVVSPREGRAWADSTSDTIKLNSRPDSWKGGRRTMVPDTGPLVHEIGHRRDPNVRDGNSLRDLTGRSDPREEGIADGYADHHGNLLASDIGRNTARRFAGTGYTTDYSGFATDTDKALYTATRAHVEARGTSDDIPNRDQLLKDRAIPEPKGLKPLPGMGGKDYDKIERQNGRKIANVNNALMLGHMLHESPHARAAVEEGGYGKAAAAATKAYDTHFPPVPHEVPMLRGPEAAAARNGLSSRRQAAGLDRWADSVDANRPNTQTERLF